jgi:nucleoid-associated protein YgaU
MKQGKIILLSFVIAVLMSPAVFAMGGPAQEEEGQITPSPAPAPATVEVQPAAPTNEAVSPEVKSYVLEFEKARLELPSLEARREKVDKYLDVLSKKIIMAKGSGDAKKAGELQATERQMSAEEKKIIQKITVIRAKFPDIQAGAGPAQAQAETSGSGIVYHDVEMGDTLVSISRKYFGSPDYYMEIAKMNNIKNVWYVAQGTRLKIDLSLKKSEMPAPAAAAVAAPQESAIVYHVVAAGDTLMSISRTYFDGSASYYKDIAEMNELTDYNLKIGMRLKIDKSFKKPAQPKL